MARIAALFVALLALVPAAPASAQSTPSQFLESGTITPYTTRDHPFVTQTSLVTGQVYRLVLTGLWEVQWPAGSDTPAYEEEDDSLYCRHQNPIPNPQNGDCNGNFLRNWHGVAAQTGNDPNPTSIYDIFPSSSTPETPNYAYDTTFRSKHDGILKFWDPYAGTYGEDGGPSSATGSFGFQLYGTPAQAPPPSGGTTGGSPAARSTLFTRPGRGQVRLTNIRCPNHCYLSAKLKGFVGGHFVGSVYKAKGVFRDQIGLLTLRLRGRAGRKVAAAIRRHRRGKLVLELSYSLGNNGPFKDKTLKFPLSGGSDRQLVLG